MTDTSARRVAVLATHFSAAGSDTADVSQLDSLSLQSTAAASSGVQVELQHLLEHDSHKERAKMKDLLRQELFVP